MAWTLIVWMSVATTLQGCESFWLERFVESEGFILVVLLVLSSSAPLMASGIFIIDLVVIIFNYTKPSRLSMKAGFVLGALHVVGTVLVGGMMVSSLLSDANAVSNSYSSFISLMMVASFLLGLWFNALILASAFHARRELED